MELDTFAPIRTFIVLYTSQGRGEGLFVTWEKNNNQLCIKRVFFFPPRCIITAKLLAGGILQPTQKLSFECHGNMTGYDKEKKVYASTGVNRSLWYFTKEKLFRLLDPKFFKFKKRYRETSKWVDLTSPPEVPTFHASRLYQNSLFHRHISHRNKNRQISKTIAQYWLMRTSVTNEHLNKGREWWSDRMIAPSLQI